MGFKDIFKKKSKRNNQKSTVFSSDVNEIYGLFKNNADSNIYYEGLAEDSKMKFAISPIIKLAEENKTSIFIIDETGIINVSQDGSFSKTFFKSRISREKWLELAKEFQDNNYSIVILNQLAAYLVGYDEGLILKAIDKFTK